MYEIIPIDSHNYGEVVRETHPELPSADELSIQEQKCQSDTLLHRVAAISEGGQMVGYGRVVCGPWDPGTKPGHFSFAILVAKRWRRRGIGQKLYDTLREFSTTHGARLLSTFVNESEPYHLEWLERQGYRLVRHTFSSELNLKQFAPDVFSDVLERAKASGFTFATLADYPDDDQTFMRFMEFFYQLANDAPHADTVAYPDAETMKHILKEVAPWDPSSIQLVLDGQRWIGMSVLIRESRERYNLVLTGVDRAYRGQGLALAVKLKSAEYAKNNGGEFVQTHNDSNNERIIRVNQQMGFVPRSGSYGLELVL
ncbi:GNAT family N-acetyltransferase [Alicyclobacillus fastidiosus]|uniref:GNAT family N-acetyltransferase n=1 Tax=Alicyclobacillus fastidiosus TaxID=392011 RepID=UPI0023E8FE7C|nr:GNAT family N-acetyltransferase [Alicyclobacillus fastidiosus]GMA66007.1 hypothetical protein GCM10025859_64490 [Alicyclobacillus fastidiosus]